MDANDLEKEFEQRLERELKEKERELIKWMVYQISLHT